MSIALVQSRGVAGSSLAFASNNAAGHLLVAIGEANSALSVSDTQGNAWGTAVKIEDPSTTFIYIWFAANCKAGANTVTVPGALNLVIAEFSGAAQSSVTDVSSVNFPPTASSSQTSGSATTTAAGELVVGAVDNGNGILPTPTAGWTTLQNVATMSTIFQLQASAGSIAATWTTPSAVFYDAIMASFKAPAAVSVTQRMALLGCGS